MFSISAAGVWEHWAHTETLAIGLCLSWPYQCITFMGNLELINRGMEEGMGFVSLSRSLSFSFHFLSNTNSSKRVQKALLEQLEYRYRPGKVVEINALSISQFKQLCFHVPNPTVFVPHCYFWFVLMLTICVCQSPRSILRSFECKTARFILKKSHCFQIIALMLSKNFIY